MRYLFKLKMNKIDSNISRNFIKEQIDMYLTNAQEVYVKKYCQGERESRLRLSIQDKGVELVDGLCKQHDTGNIFNLSTSQSRSSLPDDFWFMVRGEATVSNGSCGNVACDVMVKQNGDDDPYKRSDIFFREVWISFRDKGIEVDFNDMDIKRISLLYMPLMEPINDSNGCKLPSFSHQEIVELAAQMASADYNPQNVNVRTLQVRQNLNS